MSTQCKAPTLTDVLWGRSKVGVVHSTIVLYGDGNTVLTLATLAKVVVLEVECAFGEAVKVGSVVNRVYNVEGVGGSGSLVRVVRRVLRIIGVVDKLAIAGFGGCTPPRGTDVSDSIVATSEYMG